MARRSDLKALALQIYTAYKRLTPEPLRVHPEISQQDTGEGVLASWANRHREIDIANLLLRLLSGPFVTDLAVETNAPPERIEPACPSHPSWLSEAVHHLAHHALDAANAIPIAVSYAFDTGLKESDYQAIRGTARAAIRNARSDQDLLKILSDCSSTELRDTLSILNDAAGRALRVKVLEKARQSAKRWALDCAPQLLYDAILGLDSYAQALDNGMPRETAAKRYQERCGVEMSQEKGSLKTIPFCFEPRNMTVPGHGKQYFDMHAKPGNTRIHIWAIKEDGHTVVYIGHCGEHLPLPGRR